MTDQSRSRSLAFPQPKLLSGDGALIIKLDDYLAVPIPIPYPSTTGHVRLYDIKFTTKTGNWQWVSSKLFPVFWQAPSAVLVATIVAFQLHEHLI